ncbi:helix-turn-helix domain-containing protein [Nocardia sp. NPDC005366]|uniref:PucR family transcriptional regulator n=1 Tax=Nocardia sp. NPDC005366 TaxID=3156878 RepID=UPI0033A397B7
MRNTASRKVIDEGEGASADQGVATEFAAAEASAVRTLHPGAIRELRDRTIRAVTSSFDEAGTPASARPDGTRLAHACSDFALGLLTDRTERAPRTELARACTALARRGVLLDTVLRVASTCVREVYDLLPSGKINQLSSDLRSLVDMLETMTTIVTTAYVEDARAKATEAAPSSSTVASVLLRGGVDSTTERMLGLRIASRYHVVAIHMFANRDGATHTRPTGAERALPRIKTEIERLAGENISALLSIDGGTILLPHDTVTDDDLECVVSRLAEVGEVALVAASTSAPPEEVPAAADRSHQLLDVIIQLDYRPGLYRVELMTREGQLSYPGPGRDALAAILDPLDDHPELMTLLRAHLRNNHSRLRTARELVIHTNTVDYRLKQITRHTGWDLTTADGQWMLQSALIARSSANARSSRRA